MKKEDPRAQFMAADNKITLTDMHQNRFASPAPRATAAVRPDAPAEQAVAESQEVPRND